MSAGKLTMDSKEKKNWTIQWTFSFTIMFGIFKKKSEKEKLQEQYKKLLEESYKLSHSNRAASDQKAAEADAVLRKIEKL